MNDTMIVTITAEEYKELLTAKVRLEFLAEFAATEKYSISPAVVLRILGKEVKE